VVELEFTLDPGHRLDEALRALERNGLGPVPGLDAVPLDGARGRSWIVSVQGNLDSAQRASEQALTGVARVLGVFGSPQIAPF